jgi:hypothetical protein
LIDMKLEISKLITDRTDPLLTALDCCIDQLESYLLGVEPAKDPEAERVLSFAKRAAAAERQFQAEGLS